jgi:hypothetical protein
MILKFIFRFCLCTYDIHFMFPPKAFRFHFLFYINFFIPLPG